MKKKVLLMGKSGAGKTSMRSIIFANYRALETSRLGPTLNIEHTHIRFMGGLVLNLWDCGGQDAFFENYFSSQMDNIFVNVEIMIYVFDIEREGSQLQSDLDKYEDCLNALKTHSPDANIFVLIHKMDLAGDNERERQQKLFLRMGEIKARSVGGIEPSFYGTSIWDETLYKSWSKIVNSIIPDMAKLEKYIKDFCEVCDADEVVLFEKSSFLSICKKSNDEKFKDKHRFEKISNIIKQFKLSCNSSSITSFDSLLMKNSKFTSFVSPLSESTVLMVILSKDQEIPPAATRVNLSLAVKHFESVLNDIDP